MTNDRRKNSRRPSVPLSAEARAGRVPEPMPLDPMEQRNARRIRLEHKGKTVIDRLAIIQDTLNNSHINRSQEGKLIAEKKSLRDYAVGILAQLVKL